VHYNYHCGDGCCIEWMMESMQAAGAESREIEMEEDDIADYQQAADDQQAEAPNFPPVKIKDEENPWPHLSKQFAFQRKRGNSYIMLCKLCLPDCLYKLIFKSAQACVAKYSMCPFPLVVQTAFLLFS